MYVGNKVALHLMFLILAINTELPFRYITLDMPAASERKLRFFFYLFFLDSSNGNHVSYIELLLSASTFICNVYF